jgi:integrase
MDAGHAEARKAMNRQRTVLDDILDRSNFSPVTRRQYEAMIGAWIEFAGPNPIGWTRLAAQRFYDEQLARGIKIKSANAYIECLRYVSHWYHSVHGGEDFAMVQLRSVPDQPKTRRALAPDEVGKLLATCEDELPISKRPIDRRDRTLLIVGLETGMRAKSLAGSMLENIHRRPYPHITVPVKGAGGMATFDVPLSDTAMLAIEDWRGWLAGRGLKEGPLFASFKPFIDPKGHRAYEPVGGVSSIRIYQIVTERAKIAKIAHVHPHLLRHTFITWRLMAGLTAPQIASITAHKLGSGSSLPGGNLGEIGTYMDTKMLGDTARQSTPPWFADHVRKMMEG